MSSIGTGYDLSASQFSPDGRVFQVEYAMKAVDNSGTVIGIRTKNCVVLAVEKIVTSKLYEKSAGKRIFNVDKHIGLAICGLISDARHIVDVAIKECQDYRSKHAMPIPVKYLNDRVSMYMHAYTLYSAVRPYGCSVLVAGFENGEPKLYSIDPSGISYGYFGIAIGKAKETTKTELEKLKFNELSPKEAVIEAARIIYKVHDEVKDKHFELELSWIGEITDGVHQRVPAAMFAEAEQKARQAADDDSDSDNAV